jgi:hypothetical protein
MTQRALWIGTEAPTVQVQNSAQQGSLFLAPAPNRVCSIIGGTPDVYSMEWRSNKRLQPALLVIAVEVLAWRDFELSC